MRRRHIAVTAALVASAVAFAPVPQQALVPAVAPDAVLEVGTDAAAPTWVDRTIVVLHDDVDDVAATADRLLTPRGLAPAHLYSHALKGFAVDAPAAAVLDLSLDPDVAYVEADREVRTAAQTIPRGVLRIDADHAANVGSRRDTNVDIAIIDTGVDAHRDLRIAERVDCMDDEFEVSVEYVEWLVYGECKSGGTDNDGHGTHVAGIAAARDNTSDVVGVAPGARIWSVKVIAGTSNGSLADVINGVDHVTRHADSIEVANISLVADGTSEAMNDAIEGATDAGVVVVVAAGNARENAGSTTPANAPKAITVSAVTDLDGRPGGTRTGSCHGADDTFARYSNFGAVVDIAAPGSCIVSTKRGGGTESRSGTSMAAPHVAGAAALRISQGGFGSSTSRWSRVLDDLLSTAASENSVCGYRGSPSNEPMLDLRKGC